MSEIYFNGQSSNDFGLLIENIIDAPTTSIKYNSIDIPGSKNGSVNLNEGLNDIELSFNFVFKIKEDFIIRKSMIVKWLKSQVSQELRYSLHKGVYYLVKKIEIGEFKTTSRIVRRFTVKFTCYPIIFLEEGKEILTLIKSTVLCNIKSTYQSEPKIIIYGNGDINLNINNQSLVLKGIEGNIIVDSFLKDCYKIVNNKMIHLNNKMYSEFPILETGENIISWKGSVSQIDIIPRWCCI